MTKKEQRAKSQENIQRAVRHLAKLKQLTEKVGNEFWLNKVMMAIYRKQCLQYGGQGGQRLDLTAKEKVLSFEIRKKCH